MKATKWTDTLSFLIDAGSGMEVPPPRLPRFDEPWGGDGELGASSSTAIWDWRTKIPWLFAHLKYSLPWTKKDLNTNGHYILNSQMHVPISL